MQKRIQKHDKNQNVQNIDFFGKKNAKTAKRPPGSSLKKMPDMGPPPKLILILRPISRKLRSQNYWERALFVRKYSGYNIVFC